MLDLTVTILVAKTQKKILFSIDINDITEITSYG